VEPSNTFPTIGVVPDPVLVMFGVKIDSLLAFEGEPTFICIVEDVYPDLDAVIL